MQACRSAGRAPGPFPDGQKTRRLSVRLHSVGLGLSSARKAIFLVTNFGMRNRPSESREFVTDPFLPFSVLVRCPPSLSSLFQFLSLTAALLFVPSAEETEAKKYQTSPSRSIVETVAGGNRGREIFLLRKWIPNKKSILRRRLRRHQSFILFPCYLLPMAQILFGDEWNQYNYLIKFTENTLLSISFLNYLVRLLQSVRSTSAS